MSKFLPGAKGNPAGRPKGSRNKGDDQCREWADQYGIPFLTKVAEGKISDINGFGKKIKVSLSIRIDVTKYLTDRGKGKPRQALEHSGAIGSVSLDLTSITQENLDQLIKALEKGN